MNRYFLAFYLIAQTLFSFGQNQNNQWRFGYSGGIDFNANPPNFINGSSIQTNEGSAAVADQNTGNLLFYTDGITVWNANNQIMQNGTGLLGGSVALQSSTTAAVIVPKPESDHLYYIITIDEQFGNGNGLRYSVVDMDLNNGLGAVLTNEKNILLLATQSEKIEIIPARNCLGYWVITKDNPGNTYYAFLLGAAGFHSNPVQSIAGGIHSNGAGHLKANGDGTLLACGNSFEGTIELNNFDPSTGIVTNKVIFNTSPLTFIYGIEFSPNNNLLYASDLSQVLQFDINQSNQTDIENSAFSVVSSPFGQFASLQLAPNGVIYINAGSIDAINNPNNAGITCNYQSAVFTNQNGGGGYGLPKFVPKRIGSTTSNTILVSDTCFNAETNFTIDNPVGIDSVLWYFGDLNAATNTASGLSLSHVFSSSNVYTVTAVVFKECSIDQIERTLTIAPCTSDVIEFYEVPNVITPNNDGVNDLLDLKNTSNNTKLQIVNRWANVVYSSNDYKNDWNGNDSNGQLLTEGVYTYFYTFANGISGHSFVHLVR